MPNRSGQDLPGYRFIFISWAETWQSPFQRLSAAGVTVPRMIAMSSHCVLKLTWSLATSSSSTPLSWSPLLSLSLPSAHPPPTYPSFFPPFLFYPLLLRTLLTLLLFIIFPIPLPPSPSIFLTLSSLSLPSPSPPLLLHILFLLIYSFLPSSFPFCSLSSSVAQNSFPSPYPPLLSLFFSLLLSAAWGQGAGPWPYWLSSLWWLEGYKMGRQERAWGFLF